MRLTSRHRLLVLLVLLAVGLVFYGRFPSRWAEERLRSREARLSRSRETLRELQSLRAQVRDLEEKTGHSRRRFHATDAASATRRIRRALQDAALEGEVRQETVTAAGAPVLRFGLSVKGVAADQLDALLVRLEEERPVLIPVAVQVAPAEGDAAGLDATVTLETLRRKSAR